jgi:hypothetical protein
VPGLSAAWAPCLVAALTAAGTTALFPRGLAPVDAGVPVAERAGLSAKSCAGCHAEAHADWVASRHGRAWTNAIFQREYKDRPLEWCVHCHAPLREQLDEVRHGGGPLADEGVTCAACHLRGGRMLARARALGSPHDTEVRADFGGPDFCAGCHQFNFPIIGAGERVTGYTDHPMQDTVHQHDAGRFAARECLGCHRAGEAGHRFPGGHDAQMIGRALTLEACRDGRALEVRLTNVGAGHNVPTGDVHRHLVLRAWRADAPERLQQTVLGRRFEPAPDGGKLTVADDTLPPGATRAIRIPVAALGSRAGDDAISLEVRLVYTIDEFPFRGRELAESTWAPMLEHRIRWSRLARCGSHATSALAR